MNDVKIKGKVVFVNGVRHAEIKGWRNPRGVDHVPYVICLDDGSEIGTFAYAVDAQKWARYNFAKVTA